MSFGGKCKHPGCGLRIILRWDGWRHCDTAAGRKAEAKHKAVSK